MLDLTSLLHGDDDWANQFKSIIYFVVFFRLISSSIMAAHQTESQPTMEFPSFLQLLLHAPAWSEINCWKTELWQWILQSKLLISFNITYCMKLFCFVQRVMLKINDLFLFGKQGLMSYHRCFVLVQFSRDAIFQLKFSLKKSILKLKCQFLYSELEWQWAMDLKDKG